MGLLEHVFSHVLVVSCREKALVFPFPSSKDAVFIGFIPSSSTWDCVGVSSSSQEEKRRCFLFLLIQCCFRVESGFSVGNTLISSLVAMMEKRTFRHPLSFCSTFFLFSLLFFSILSFVFHFEKILLLLLKKLLKQRSRRIEHGKRN